MLRNQLISELLWLLIAAILALAVAMPAYLSLGSYYLIEENIAIVFAFVTVLRLIFFATASPWLRPLFMKGIVILSIFPLGLFTMLTLNDIQTTIDAEGYAFLWNATLDTKQIVLWGKYIRNEFIFFGAGLLICLVILPFVMLVQAWRQVKAAQKVNLAPTRSAH